MTTVQGLEYYVSTTPERTLTPLTEDEILIEHSALLWSALVAFATDPGYFEEMCDAAYASEHGRAIRSSSARLASLRKRLGAKITLDGECWTWTAATGKNHTPVMRVAGKTITARSWTVEQWHGADETRWMIRSDCGNGLCVNPQHATWRTVQRSS